MYTSTANIRSSTATCGHTEFQEQFQELEASKLIDVVAAFPAKTGEERAAEISRTNG
jgi:hypothetical protein